MEDNILLRFCRKNPTKENTKNKTKDKKTKKPAEQPVFIFL